MINVKKNRPSRSIGVISQYSDKDDSSISELLQGNVSYHEMLQSLDMSCPTEMLLNYVSHWYYEYWLNILKKLTVLYAGQYFLKDGWSLRVDDVARTYLPKLFVTHNDDQFDLLKILLISCKYVDHSKTGEQIKSNLAILLRDEMQDMIVIKDDDSENRRDYDSNIQNDCIILD